MNEEYKLIEDLILSGALEISGIDIDTGEMLYNFTKKLLLVNPDMYDEFQNYLESEAMILWQNGFINMDITSKNPMISLTNKAFNELEVLKLNKTSQYTLKEIARILLDKG